ncbi:MAG: hypothetical protein CSA74_10125 [Rhodobacterales bacterium]|nr:MAG: hypothetical protein CSA74_10125 [Rhodobacterales bacterium]
MTDPAFWTPAAARPQLWRTALGIFLVALIWIGTAYGLILLAARVSGLSPQMVMDTTRWAGTALFFLTFIGLHLGLAIVLPLLHRRGYTSLFGPRGRLNHRHLRNGAAVMLAVAGGLYALMAVEHLVLPEGVSPAVTRLRPAGSWLISLAPALALIFIQVAAEEVLFRGYLLQQLRARAASPLVWALAPALVFGVLHFNPATYGYVNASAYVFNAATVGTLTAFVTLRTGNLGATIGLHFGNNASIALFGIEGELSGFALYGIAMDPASGYATYSILTQTFAVVAVFALWWRWMARHRPIANPPHAA